MMMGGSEPEDPPPPPQALSSNAAPSVAEPATERNVFITKRPLP